MANNDILQRDDNIPSFSYNPEILDLGNNVRRALTGMADGANQTLGSKVDIAATSDTANASLMALMRRGLVNWTTLLAKIPSKGAANTASAWAVSIATDQNAIPTTLSGNVNVGNFPASQNVVVTSLTASINVGNFPATSNVNVLTSVLASGAANNTNQNTVIGILNYIANTSPPLGQTLKANSIPVVIASDYSLPTDSVIKGVATWYGNTIAVASTSQLLLAANTNRRGFSVQNQSTSDLYIKVGNTATLDYKSLRIAPGVLYETPSYHTSTGIVNIIGAVANAAFYCTEL